MALNSMRAAAGILLLSFVVVAGHIVPVLDNSVIESGMRNALHIVAFAVFALVVFAALDRLTTPRAVAVTLLAVIVVAGSSEAIQFLVGTRPDPWDVVRDLAGATLALGGRHMWRKSRQRKKTSKLTGRVFGAMTMLVAAMIIAPLSYWLIVIGLSRSAFPVILSFDHWWERYRYVPINSEVTLSGKAAAKAAESGLEAHLRLSYWGRSGIGVRPAGSDWTDYDYLAFAAQMISGPDTTVTVRINDTKRVGSFSNRFIASITVTGEPAVFRIPLDELVVDDELPPIDLSDIRELVIFARDKRGDNVMLLDDIRLE